MSKVGSAIRWGDWGGQLGEFELRLKLGEGNRKQQFKKQQLELVMEQRAGFKWGKEYVKACILSPCLFNLHAEYIIQSAGLDESQAGIKIARRNSNNLRYADDTTLRERRGI